MPLAATGKYDPSGGVLNVSARVTVVVVVVVEVVLVVVVVMVWW